MAISFRSQLADKGPQVRPAPSQARYLVPSVSLTRRRLNGGGWNQGEEPTDTQVQGNIAEPTLGPGTLSYLVYLTYEHNCKEAVPKSASSCVSLVLAVSAIFVGKWHSRGHGFNFAS